MTATSLGGGTDRDTRGVPFDWQEYAVQTSQGSQTRFVAVGLDVSARTLAELRNKVGELSA